MAIFNQALLTTLLGSIETGRLLVLAGAGLSMPNPSYLKSALEVAHIVYDKWHPTEPTLPRNLRDDLNSLAGHFYRDGKFEDTFIASLVPWDDLVGQPNPGHEALADFLIIRAIHAAVLTNFDPLIEQWAQSNKVAMQGALNGMQASEHVGWNPLLKIHGCFHLNKDETLWTQEQLRESTVKDRIDSCANWLKLNLPNKHLLVVGFWTDSGLPE